MRTKWLIYGFLGGSVLAGLYWLKNRPATEDTEHPPLDPDGSDYDDESPAPAAERTVEDKPTGSLKYEVKTLHRELNYVIEMVRQHGDGRVINQLDDLVGLMRKGIKEFDPARRR